MLERALLPVLGLAVLGVLSASCSGSRSAEAVPQPSPASTTDAIGEARAVEPPPTGTATRPVQATVTYEGVRLDRSGSKLFVPGSARDARPPLDEAGMRSFLGEVARTLDAHLTSLQAGVATPLPAPLDATTAPAAARAATTDLASPDATITSAVYDVDVAVDATVHWAHVTVTVTRADGSIRQAEFVFATTDGPPQMIAAGPHAGGGA